MAQVNPLTREVLVKLVYYGPGLGGKTTSLHCVHASSPPETRGQIVSLATPVDRTLYFDFLPLRVSSIRGHHVRLQLFTVPGQVYFNATRKLVLTGADGIVFVADSQVDRQDANLESLENLATNLEEQGRSLNSIPLVLQYNKRDLADVLDVADMNRSLNALGVPFFPTSALRGEGVLDALDGLLQLVLDDLEARQAFGTAVEAVTEPRFVRAEAALEEQIGRASEQIWRATVQRAIATRQQASPLPPTPDAAAPAAAPAATIAHASPSRGLTWAPLFGPDAEEVRRLERDLAQGRFADAISRADEVARAILADAARRGGLSEGLRNHAVVALLLGLDGGRWLGFRRLARRVRDGGPVDERDALTAYAVVLDLALRRDQTLS